MIETDKERAVVAKDISDPQIGQWLNKQNSYKIAIGQTGALTYDTVIARFPVETSGNLEVLRNGQFNRQHSWFKARKPLSEWSGGPFHMNNEVVMATWLCGKAGIKTITFLDFRAEETAESEFDRRQFRNVMKKLIEEFGLRIRFTASDSQLFREIGATHFDPNLPFEEDAVDPVALPSTDEVFGNDHVDVNIKARNRLLIHQNVDVGAVAVVEGPDRDPVEFVVVDHIPDHMAYIGFDRILLTNEDAVKKAVERFGSKKDIYLLDQETKLKIDQVKEDYGSLSPAVTALLAFSIGSDFGDVETRGVIENATGPERELLEGLAKHKNVNHV